MSIFLFTKLAFYSAFHFLIYCWAVFRQFKYSSKIGFSMASHYIIDENKFIKPIPFLAICFKIFAILNNLVITILYINLYKYLC